MALSEELVQQFRGVALSRLERVEVAWSTVQSSLDDAAASSIHREIHTLKGESQLLGFSDINMVCHKLEDLLEVARARGYAVDEDFDLAVNMALRFMAMLVRKKVGAQLRGIDLAGFIKQIDTLLEDLAPLGPTPVRATTGTMPSLKREGATPRVSHATRARLGPIAVDAFVEYAAARGARRDRLRSSWHALRDMIGIQRAVLGAGQLAKHRTGALSLARDLGKVCEVSFDVDTAEITSETLAALDSVVLHLVRNAVDHGLEAPDVRAAAGKPRVGRLRLRCGVRDDRLVLEVEDDGRGVAYGEVLSRAIDLGLVAPATTDIRDRWLDLVCAPGFTTRTQTSDVSGRGVGLDAVRAAVTDAGGTLHATTEAGRGTTWTVAIPQTRLTLSGHVLRAPGVPFPVFVDESWRLLDEGYPAAPIVDVALRLGLLEEGRSGTVRYLSNGTQTIGLHTERPPSTTQVRRTINVPAPSPLEIVTLDTVEGIQIHPDRMILPR